MAVTIQLSGDLLDRKDNATERWFHSFCLLTSVWFVAVGIQYSDDDPQTAPGQVTIATAVMVVVPTHLVEATVSTYPLPTAACRSTQARALCTLGTLARRALAAGLVGLSPCYSALCVSHSAFQLQGVSHPLSPNFMIVSGSVQHAMHIHCQNVEPHCSRAV